MSKPPVEVRPVDVFDFLIHQRGDRKVVRIADGESGLSARTIARRSTVPAAYSALSSCCDRSFVCRAADHEEIPPMASVDVTVSMQAFDSWRADQWRRPESSVGPGERRWSVAA